MYWNEYKTKNENKNIANKYRYFLESSFVGVNRLLNFSLFQSRLQFKNIYREKVLFTKSIIKNYTLIIDRKICYNQPIDSDTQRYEEIKTLTTGQGKVKTTGCLLYYDCIISRNRLIPTDLSRKKN